MENKDFKHRYKSMFDGIAASDELRSEILNLKPQKRQIGPYKAVIGSVAAAVMMFCAVYEYNFKPDDSGVISETAVSTQIPVAAFEPARTNSPKAPKEQVGSAVVKPKTTEQAIATQTPQNISSGQTPEPDSPTLMPDAESDIEIAAYDYTPSAYSRSGGEGGNLQESFAETEIWETSRYYDYIGTNIEEKVNGIYTGPEEFEFETDKNGLPLDDTAVFTFVRENGGNIRITVSRTVLFDGGLSGVVAAVGEGYNGYKLSNGVYYKVYTTKLTQDETAEIINKL